jgi:hypothetical protein
MSEKNYITSNIIEYRNVKGVTGFDCYVRNEDENNYYKKEFRYSVDKILWSDYKELTNKNLSKISVPEGDVLYVEYRFTRVGSGDKELVVESISLNMDFVGDTEPPIPECYWMTPAGQGVGGNCCKPQIVYDCGCGDGNNTFNPYALGNSLSIYRQMCMLVSNMFGICCLYFKTEPNKRSRDVILKEYSLENVVDKQNIKVLIPDNQLPTREIQFNSMMMDYPVQFEVHIVKQEFWNVFGEGTHPDPHDYIYFQSYMNKMYRVDSVSDPDDFGYLGTYWRVSLTPYEQMSSVGFEDESLKEDTETLIFSAEGKFADEVSDESMDNRKDNQLNDLGDLAEGQDWLRRVLDTNLRIVDEKVFNGYTMVADRHYDMSTVEKGSVAVEYRYSGGFSSSDERMFSFMFRPKFTDMNVGGNMIVERAEDTPAGIRLKLKSWDRNVVSGNYLMIRRTGGADGYRKIVFADKSGMSVVVEGGHSGNYSVTDCSKAIAHDVNQILEIWDEGGSSVMTVEQTPTQVLVTLDGTRHEYSFPGFDGFEDKWYVILLGMNRGRSNMWLYEVSGSEKFENMKSSFKRVGVAVSELGQFGFGEPCRYGLVAARYDVTNFRLWDRLCEEGLHNVILSQHIVDDTHNTLIVDNAKNELLLNYKWS